MPDQDWIRDVQFIEPAPLALPVGFVVSLAHNSMRVYALPDSHDDEARTGVNSSPMACEQSLLRGSWRNTSERALLYCAALDVSYRRNSASARDASSEACGGTTGCSTGAVNADDRTELCVTMAGGTAFGAIVIWRVSFSLWQLLQRADTAQTEEIGTLHHIAAHDGSVFGVRRDDGAILMSMCV